MRFTYSSALHILIGLYVVIVGVDTSAACPMPDEALQNARLQTARNWLYLTVVQDLVVYRNLTNTIFAPSIVLEIDVAGRFPGPLVAFEYGLMNKPRFNGQRIAVTQHDLNETSIRWLGNATANDTLTYTTIDTYEVPGVDPPVRFHSTAPETLTFEPCTDLLELVQATLPPVVAALVPQLAISTEEICKNLLATCPNTALFYPFPSFLDCVSYFDELPLYCDGAVLAGNTRLCRQLHAISSLLDPITHCPHVAQVSEFCNDGTCPGLKYVYGGEDNRYQDYLTRESTHTSNIVQDIASYLGIVMSYGPFIILCAMLFLVYTLEEDLKSIRKRLEYSYPDFVSGYVAAGGHVDESKEEPVKALQGSAPSGVLPPYRRSDPKLAPQVHYVVTDLTYTRKSEKQKNCAVKVFLAMVDWIQSWCRERQRTGGRRVINQEDDLHVPLICRNEEDQDLIDDSEVFMLDSNTAASSPVPGVRSPLPPRELQETLLQSRGSSGVGLDIRTSDRFSDNDRGRSKSDKGSTALSNIYLHMQSGEMIAIMGPSGCGKTTLLKLLAGRSQHGGGVTGRLTVRVEESSSSREVVSPRPKDELQPGRFLPVTGRWIRKSVGFVAQEQELIPSLTPLQTLIYYAMLKLPLSMTREQKVARALQCLNEVGLAHIADQIIGKAGVDAKTSGGEKRRLCVAIQMLSLPCMIFLDEPTSGLDTSSGVNLLQLCRDLADRGNRSVICTIHTPTSAMLALFDKVALLNSNGEMAYFGPVGDLLTAERESPSRALLVSNEEEKKEQIQKVNEELQNIMAGLAEGRVPFRIQEHFDRTKVAVRAAGKKFVTDSDAKQDRLKAKDDVSFQFPSGPRYFLNNLTILLARFWSSVSLLELYSFSIICLVQGVLLVVIFPDLSRSRMGDMYARGMACLIGMSAIANTLFFQVCEWLVDKEKRLFVQDHLDGASSARQVLKYMYIRDSWFLTMGIIPFFLILYYGIGFRTDDLWAAFLSLLIWLLFSQVAQSFGVLVCLLVKNPVSTMACGTWTAFNVIFAGLVRKVDDLPGYISWLCYLMPQYHALGAIMRIEFQNAPMDCKPFDYPALCSTGNNALDFVGFTDVNVGVSLFVLCAYITIQRHLACVTIRRLAAAHDRMADALYK